MREPKQLTTGWMSSNFSFSCGLDQETLEKTRAIQELASTHGLSKPAMSLIARQALHHLHDTLESAEMNADLRTLMKHLDAMRWLRRRGLKGQAA